MTKNATVTVLFSTGKLVELKASAMEVLDGSLTVYCEEVTLVEQKERVSWFGKHRDVKTKVHRQRYTVAVFEKNTWTAAWAKVNEVSFTG